MTTMIPFPARRAALFAALGAALTLAGCSTTPNYDARFGEAVRAAKASMVLYPDAAAQGDEVLGMDGRAARDAMDRYQDSFHRPPPVTNVINIGGQNGAQR